MSIENYKDGKLEGFSEEYYENRKLDDKGNYKNGLREGLWEFFYESGSLMSIENYKDGKFEGLREEYYENGQLSFRGTYTNGDPGSFQYYDKEGNKEIGPLSTLIRNRWIIDFSVKSWVSNVFTFTPDKYFIYNKLKTPNKNTTVDKKYTWYSEGEKITISINDGYTILEGSLISDNKIEGIIKKHGQGTTGTWTGEIYGGN